MQIQRKIQQQGPINDDPSRLQYQHAIDNEPKEAQQHNKYNCFFIPSYFWNLRVELDERLRVLVGNKAHDL